MPESTITNKNQEQTILLLYDKSTNSSEPKKTGLCPIFILLFKQDNESIQTKLLSIME